MSTTSSSTSAPRELVRVSTTDQVTTITLNNPRRLNGWTQSMMTAMFTALDQVGRDDTTQVAIITGEGDYYSAGVNLSGTLKLAHPRTLHAQIVEHNAALFNAFIRFPKPIIAAVNGRAIGAPVTSATLCDAMMASEKATFSTPFARLGVPPEGCSSVVFEKLMGADNAARMLGAEGWVPTAAEAADAGLITHIVPHDDLLAEAHALAQRWIEEGRTRGYRVDMTRDELEAVNARESVQLATAFLSPPFIEGQLRFLLSRKKYGPALMFAVLRLTHPLWSLLL